MIRVKLLSAGRLAALAVFVSIASVLAVYLTMRGSQDEKGVASPKLQGRVVAVFNNTRYLHEIDGRVRYSLTAGVDRAYEDGTHELEQVRLEAHGSDGTRTDVVSADRAKISDPSILDELEVEFISNVVISTTEGLEVKSAYLHYDAQESMARTDELIEFASEGVSGRSIGARIEVKDERVHLLRDVDVRLTVEGAPRSSTGAGKTARKRAPAVTADEKAARKARRRQRRLEKKRAGSPQRPDRPGKTVASSGAGTKKEATRIRSQAALLEKKENRITLTGGATVTRTSFELKADRMIAHLSPGNRIERMETTGDSMVKDKDKIEIKSRDMEFLFGESQGLVSAVASGGAEARSIGAPPSKYVKASIIEAIFTEGGESDALLDTLTASGNAYVLLEAAPPTDKTANPSSRELSAGTITLKFQSDGRSISSGSAIENATMVVTPIRAETGVDRKTLQAERMSALFFEEGNRIRTFTGDGKVNIRFDPTIAGSRSSRTTASDRVEVLFERDSQDAERILQEGNFKYLEGDRSATASRAIFQGRSELLNLRGGRPTLWDPKLRTQANEIDYDTKAEVGHARGDVRTTYFARESSGDFTPFNESGSPVYITADRAETSNSEGVAVYIGNARGWQDNNFVKADRIELYEKDQRMVATGNVESALYRMKGGENGSDRTTPGFASASKMIYSDPDRLVRYEGAVKARQGADSIDAGAVDVFLEEESNEVRRLIAVGDVVLRQPGRRGSGEQLTYTAEDGKAVLTGRLARVESAEKGSTMGAKLTFYSRDDKIVVDNQHGTGRVRSAHRLTKNGER